MGITFCILAPKYAPLVQKMANRCTKVSPEEATSLLARLPPYWGFMLQIVSGAWRILVAMAALKV